MVEFGNYFIDQSAVYDLKFQVIMELDFRTDVPTKMSLKDKCSHAFEVHEPI